MGLGGARPSLRCVCGFVARWPELLAGLSSRRLVAFGHDRDPNRIVPETRGEFGTGVKRLGNQCEDTSGPA
jgi:hypothetical protein